MKIRKICKGIPPIAAILFAAALSGCDGHVTINGDEGEKLSELDMSGAAPNKLVLAGPDHVKLSEGDKLAITVDGDPAGAEQLRFTLKDGTLGILRLKGWKDGSAVTVNVTMPAPQDLTLAGSGSINAAKLANNAKVTVAGSGDVNAGVISGDSFKLSLVGSGAMRGSGTVKDLDLTIPGSGSADLTALRTDHAKVTILGSGNASFASDGDVSATIMGSGKVTVTGRATCKVTAMGSGKLVCESGEPQKAKADE